MSRKRNEKTSRYRGVAWSNQKRRWRVSIRREEIEWLCHTELEAAMLYNAVARAIWQDRRIKLNPTPWMEMGDYCMKIGKVFWLTPDKYAIVDQEPGPDTPWHYRRLQQYEWFLHKGMAKTAIYNPDKPKDQRLYLIPMHFVVFEGPCRHINGYTLDNRLANLTDAPMSPPSGTAKLVTATVSSSNGTVNPIPATVNSEPGGAVPGPVSPVPGPGEGLPVPGGPQGHPGAILTPEDSSFPEGLGDPFADGPEPMPEYPPELPS